MIAGARAVRDGADVVIAGGVESMTRAPFVLAKAERAFSRQAGIHDTTIGWRFGGRGAADHDVIELNEAFAAQVLACLRAWGIADDDPRVNARGGGISMGHPLGMSGARIAGTAARRLAEAGGQSALATLCVGVGRGVALELLAA